MNTPLILVADDNADDQLLVGEALSETGVKCRVEMVDDGRKAFEYVSGGGVFGDRQRYPEPDVMLLDLKMPIMDGFQTLEALQADERWALLPVIILSASELPQDIKRAYRLGANGYLVKPSGLAELAEMMAAVAAYWLRFNRSPLAE